MKIRNILLSAILCVPVLLVAQSTYKSVMFNADSPPSDLQFPYYDAGSSGTLWKSISWTNIVDQPSISNIQVYKPANAAARTGITPSEGDIAIQQDTLDFYVGNDTPAWELVKRGRFFTVANSAALSALTTMSEGDVAIQIDTDQAHFYNGSIWNALDRGKTFIHGSASARASETAMKDGDISWSSSFENRVYFYDEETAQWKALTLDSEYVAYDNTTSGLTATNVKAALDELDSTMDAYTFNTSSISNSATNSVYVHNAGNGTEFEIDTRASSNAILDSGAYFSGANVEAVTQEIGDDIVDLLDSLGLSDDETNFGAMPGTYLDDNEDATSLFQEIDIALSSIDELGNIRSIGREGFWHFDGNNDHASIGLQDFGTGDFTIALEISHDDTPGGNEILLTRAAGNNRWQLLATATGYSLKIVNGAGAISTYSWTVTPFAGRHSLVFVADRDSNAEFFLDGVSQGTTSISADSAVDLGSGNSSPITLGYSSGSFDGKIHSVRFYSETKTSAEAKEIASGANDVEGLTLFFSPFSVTDQTWIDVSGQQRAAIAINTPVYGQGVADRSFVKHSEFAQELPHDGGYRTYGTNYIELDESKVEGLEKFTIINTVYFNDTTGNSEYWFRLHGVSAGDLGFDWVRDGAGETTISAVTSAGGSLPLSQGVLLPEKQVHVVALSWDNGTYSIFHNGEKVASGTTAAGWHLPLDTNGYWLGNNNASFTGDVTWLGHRFFNYDLSDEAVQEYSRGMMTRWQDVRDLENRYVQTNETDRWDGNDGVVTLGVDSIGGVDDVLRFVCDNGNSAHSIDRTNSFEVGKSYRVSGRYYIPSTNSNLDGFSMNYGTSGGVPIYVDSTPSTDTWVTFTSDVLTVSGSPNNPGTWITYGLDGGASLFTDSGGDDAMYFADLVVEPLGEIANFSSAGVTPNLWENAASDWHASIDGPDFVKPKLQETYVLEQQSIKDKIGTGPAYYFDGTDDRLDPPNSVSDFNAMTWVAEVYPDPSRASGNGYVVSSLGNGAFNNRRYLNYDSGSEEYSMTIGDTLDQKARVSIPKERGVIAYSYDGDAGVVKGYWNGKLLVEDSITAQYDVATVPLTTFGIGHLAGANFFKGHIFGVRVYNRILTDAEIELVSRGQHLGAEYFGASGVYLYEQNTSAGVDAWATSAATVAGNIDAIGGEDDTLRLTVDASNGVHYATRSIVGVAGKKYRLTGKYYIPSSNSHVDGITFGNWATMYSSVTPALDTWVDVDVEFVKNGTGNNFRIIPLDGGISTVNDAGGDDVVYLLDVKVVQVGLVLDLDSQSFTSGTAYDSSGNDYDGVVSGASLINSNHHWHGIEAESDGDVVIESDLTVTDTVTISTVAQDNALTKVLVLDGTDTVKWRDESTIGDAGSGDDLGNHTATTDLNMATFDINSITDLDLDGDIIDNVGATGSNGQYLGKDAGSVKWLTLSGADNLGNHTATQSLDMSSNAITNVTSIDIQELYDSTNAAGTERQYLGAQSDGDVEWYDLSTIYDSDGDSSAGWLSDDTWRMTLDSASGDYTWDVTASSSFERFQNGAEFSSVFLDSDRVALQVNDNDVSGFFIDPALFSLTINGVNSAQYYFDRDELSINSANLNLNSNDIDSVSDLDLDNTITDSDDQTGSNIDFLGRDNGGVIWRSPDKVYSPNESNEAGWQSNTDFEVKFGASTRFEVNDTLTTVDTTTVDLTGANVNNVNDIEIDGNVIDYNGSTGADGEVLTRRSGGGVDWTAIPASGEVNTASNVGGGQGVYKEKSGVDLRFKSLVAGTNITIDNNAYDLTINSTASAGESWRIVDDADWNSSEAKITVGGTSDLAASDDGDVEMYVYDGTEVNNSNLALKIYSHSTEASPGVVADPGGNNSTLNNDRIHPVGIKHGDLIIEDDDLQGYGIVMRVQPNVTQYPSSEFVRIVVRKDGDGNNQLVIEPYDVP